MDASVAHSGWVPTILSPVVPHGLSIECLLELPATILAVHGLQQ